MRIAKFLLILTVFSLATACAPQVDEAYPAPSERSCAPWLRGVSLRLEPSTGGRYAISLGGLSPGEPFSLRYVVSRGDFQVEEAFDAQTDAQGGYRTFSVEISPAPTSTVSYPYPPADLPRGSAATYWDFTLLRGEERYCMTVSMIP